MSNKQRRCPLCKSAIGIDCYIYDSGDSWYHYWCGNKVLEKSTKLTRKEKNFIEEMTEKKNKKEWKTKEKDLPNKQYIEIPISKAELDYLRDEA